jgi:hypothetical protein
MKARKVLAVVCIIVSTVLANNWLWEIFPELEGDGGLVSQAVWDVLWVAGVAGAFFSVRWYMKLRGRTRKVSLQALAAILFWYSLGSIFSLLAYMVMGFRGEVGVFIPQIAVPLIVAFALIAYFSWKWRQRLRAAEKAVQTSAQPNEVRV